MSSAFAVVVALEKVSNLVQILLLPLLQSGKSLQPIGLDEFDQELTLQDILQFLSPVLGGDGTCGLSIGDGRDHAEEFSQVSFPSVCAFRSLQNICLGKFELTSVNLVVKGRRVCLPSPIAYFIPLSTLSIHLRK